ncbi:MAG: TspO/MBR family protein [Patescibacteria group bacterium]|nr:TspO/MBR family protein [bacterium]MDZ4227552.1 TspO/MBR family protein [Patescibacteria group bacterium]
MKAMTRTAIAFIATYSAGFIGYLLIDTQPASWYSQLAKPALTPPDAAFSVVWLILYALMAVALAIVWNHRPFAPHVEGWVRFYFVQLLFNAAWTLFFFGLHAIFIAFIDILFLAFIIISLVAGAFEIDRRAAYLLMPHLAWVLFAAYLNLGIWLIN